jgi:hypothetical protein
MRGDLLPRHTEHRLGYLLLCKELLTMEEIILSRKAVEILRQVQVCILREYWLYDQNRAPVTGIGMTCNSPCCFSGWVAWVKGGKKLLLHGA